VDMLTDSIGCDMGGEVKSHYARMPRNKASEYGLCFGRVLWRGDIVMLLISYSVLSKLVLNSVWREGAASALGHSDLFACTSIEVVWLLGMRFAIV
jgi:hypothetical protein